MKPSSTDILVAIAKIAADDWIDPLETGPVRWDCDLFDPEGRRVTDGSGHTAQEAMAMAWVNCWAPDAVVKGRIEDGEVPFDIADGWRFELTPPWRSKPDEGCA